MKEVNWLEYFSGGVPTGEFFRMTLMDVDEVAKTSKEKMGINRTLELCLIGLVSYFEAFCKDHFASIVNIIPELLNELRTLKFDISIDATRALLLEDKLKYRFGFLLAEQYDFGTAKKINSNYGAILKVTPFSKKEEKEYDKILSDRNLIVHHGGVVTLRYAEQILKRKSVEKRAYFDSVVINEASYKKIRVFFLDMAQKILLSTHSAMKSYVNDNDILIDSEKIKAIDSFLWWGDVDISQQGSVAN
jgi:hypothetical protein